MPWPIPPIPPVTAATLASKPGQAYCDLALPRFPARGWAPCLIRRPPIPPVVLIVEDDPLLRGVVRILRHRAGAFRRIPDAAPDRVTGQMLTFRNDRLWRKAAVHTQA